MQIGKTRTQKKFEKFLDKYLEENEIFCEDDNQDILLDPNTVEEDQVLEPNDPLGTMGLGYKQYFKVNAFLLYMLTVLSIIAMGMIVCYSIASQTNLKYLPSSLVV